MKTKKKATKEAKPRGLSVPKQPDETLGAIVGNKPKPATMAIKKLWVYIKENKLQSKKDGRVILCGKDTKLRKLFGGLDEVNMFKVAGAIQRHMSTIEED